MSLDVSLYDGTMELFTANITHNLGDMARKAGIYQHLWHPDEHDIHRAYQLIAPLTAGVVAMATEKARFEKFDAENGWGTWADFLPWCCAYLQACKDFPMAEVRVSR